MPPANNASKRHKAPKLQGLQRFSTEIKVTQRSIPTLLRSQELSADGRRVKEKFVPVQPPSPLKKRSKILEAVSDPRGTYSSDYRMDFGFGFGSFGIGGEYGVPALPQEALEDKEVKRKKRADASRRPMKDWMELTPKFLAELMAHEGPREAEKTMKCEECKTPGESLSRCRDCFSRRLLCSRCIVAGHQSRPFDRVEWNRSFFERTTLCKLGLVVQLGHQTGEQCSKPQRSRVGFVVVDIEGIQEVSLQFCECKAIDITGEKWEQLMRARLYPATVAEPHTAFTFRTLSYFHHLTTQGKVSLYDFYRTLEKRTDASGISDPKDRYEAFIRVMRQWRYLRMLQRAGIGNQQGRPFVEIEQGELAVCCPACPHPGVNMPDNFSMLSKQFLYHKFISIDACFRLKRRRILSEQKDPGLFTGLAYFVCQKGYQPWLKSVGDQKETSSCKGLAAIEQANTKYSRGYATTGSILCLCARHEIVEPTSMVDLKRGEKYGLSDFAVGSSQRHSDERLFRVLCYDIVCQYHKKFFERMASLPAVARIGLHQDRWKFAVPKLHIQGHERRCQENFALHFMLGAGQTDGEGIERHWANLGPIGTSTREMGPGHRRDTIDDHMGAWNWSKVIGLGLLLRKRRRKAEEEQKKQAIELADFSEGLEEAVIEEWMKEVDDWESGRSSKNPYTTPPSGKTEQDVWLEYAEQEEEEQKLGIPLLHEVTPSAFLKLGLDIEEAQRHLRIDLKNTDYNTANQKTEIADRHARISRAILRLRTIQQVYIPMALSWGQANSEQSEGGAENTPLWLPSNLPETVRSLPQLSSWVKMEVDFRRGQLNSALDGVRSHLFVWTRLIIQRSLHVRHQKGTCSGSCHTSSPVS
ncbi:hypothetical protein VNI00_018122 [Paramarasmius palmivorus]|uniref:CxC2-like cysteine cluster KDZ transposase-associated domain-containing protein n=1 Tax=Paramarasmius palmivorus TaxID=297713 RepID=A0AAW0B1X9_9AGAR